MKMPSFKEFVEAHNPAMAFVYVLIIAVSVLFTFLIRANAAENRKQDASLETCSNDVRQLRTEVSFLNEQIRRKDSAWSSLDTKFKVFKELKIIP